MPRHPSSPTRFERAEADGKIHGSNFSHCRPAVVIPNSTFWRAAYVLIRKHGSDAELEATRLAECSTAATPTLGTFGCGSSRRSRRSRHRGEASHIEGSTARDAAIYYYLQRTRFERIAERKLRRRQLTDDGNVEITGPDLRERAGGWRSDLREPSLRARLRREDRASAILAPRNAAGHHTEAGLASARAYPRSAAPLQSREGRGSLHYRWLPEPLNGGHARRPCRNVSLSQGPCAHWAA